MPAAGDADLLSGDYASGQFELHRLPITQQDALRCKRCSVCERYQMLIRDICAFRPWRLLWAGSGTTAGACPAATKQAIENIAQVNSAAAEVEIAPIWAALAVATTATKRVASKTWLPIFVNLTAIILAAFFGIR